MLIKKLREFQCVLKDDDAAIRLKVTSLCENNATVVEKMRAQEKKRKGEGGLDNLQKQRDESRQNLADAEKAHIFTEKELKETVERNLQLKQKSKEISAANIELVSAELDRLGRIEKEICKERQMKIEASERERDRQTELETSLNGVNTEIKNIEAEYRGAEENLDKLMKEIEREKKADEKLSHAQESLSVKLQDLLQEVTVCDAAVVEIKAKKEGIELLRKEALEKEQVHFDAMDQRHREVEDVRQSLDLEKVRHHSLNTTRLEHELMTKRINGMIRQANSTLALEKKKVQIAKMNYVKKKQIVDGIRDFAPHLQRQQQEIEQQLKRSRREVDAQTTDIEALKEKLEVGIAGLLQQENVESGSEKKLQNLLEEIELTEDKILSLRGEENKQGKLISVNSSEREMIAREVIRCKQNEKDATVKVKINELSLLNLEKKGKTIEARSREFCALQEAVRTERNNYKSLIKSSNEVLSQMRAKVSLLVGEYQKLQMEHSDKSTLLNKEILQHQTSINHRDALHIELTQVRSDAKEKVMITETQRAEIERLNGIICSLKREMVRLECQRLSKMRGKETAAKSLVEKREEISQLRDNVTFFDEALTNGRKSMYAKEEDFRILKLQVMEAKRKIEIVRRNLVENPDCKDRIAQCQRILDEENKRTEELCHQLENPSSSGRWETLDGKIPDAEEMAVKLGFIEERLSKAKKHLLEKEIMIEETNKRINDLREKINCEKEKTVPLTCQVNEYEGKIKQLNRKMMAIVSELSMYQATAVTLQEKEEHLQQELTSAEMAFSRGDPPNEEVRIKFEREQHYRATADWYNEKENVGISWRPIEANSNMHEATVYNGYRTSAEPRPVAYIPDESLGIPKPYGAMPFKPTEAGSTMRHIRPPAPTVIEL